MHSCRHYVRTLESLSNEVTRIHLRQQRAQRFFQHYRQFSTRSPPRQLQAARIPQHDDAFVPFDADQVKQEDLRTSTLTRPSNVRDNDEEPAPEDWHAEVEILPQPELMEGGQAVTVEQERLSANEATSRVAHTGDRRAAKEVEIVHAQPSSNAERRPATLATILGEVQAEPTRSRAESRQERKLRRIQAGKYRPSTASPIFQEDEPSQAQIEPTQMESVLAKLNEMEDEGPQLPIVARVPKVARVRDAGEKVKDRKDVKNGVTVRPDKLLPKPKRERWSIQKEALEHKFGEVGWQPRKRLSPDTLEGIRALHASDPASYSTELLSEHFKITPEAIRRILRSKWRPNDDETEDRKSRWERRGVKKWQDMAQQGVRPPAKWRAMGVGSPDGPAEEKVPRRRRKNGDDDRVSWDALVGGTGPEKESFHTSLAERIL